MGMITKFIQRNSTNQIIEVFAANTSDKGLSGYAFGDVTVQYFFRGQAGAFTMLTPINNPNADTYLELGWKEVDSTDLIGVYQFGLPDAVFASSAKEVVVIFHFISGTAKDFWVTINLTDLDNVSVDNAGLDNVIVENQVNLTANVKNALQIILSAVAGCTSGAGTSNLEFRPAGAEQADTSFRIKATMDSNNDRSEIEFS